MHQIWLLPVLSAFQGPFQAMPLLTQRKHGNSALELKRQLGLHDATTWAIRQKLLQVMLERESRTALSGAIEVVDAYMTLAFPGRISGKVGEHHGGKRGQGAAGKTAFVAAVQADPKNPASVLRMRMKALQNVGGKELKTWFSRGFVKGTKVLTDGWKSYNFLESEGFKHEPQVLPGDWRSARHPTFP